MLLCGIDKDYTEKIDIASAFSDMFKLYMNPEMYRDEAQYKKTGKVPGQNVNMDFKRQQATGRLYGIPRPSSIVRKALDAVYKKKGKDIAPIRKVDLNSLLGSDEKFIRRAQINEEDTVG